VDENLGYPGRKNDHDLYRARQKDD